MSAQLDEVERLLGKPVMDEGTFIEGRLVAVEVWWDRSWVCTIQRPGVDNNGAPWPLHEFPYACMRLVGK